MDALVIFNCCSVDGKRVISQGFEVFENFCSLKDLKKQIESFLRGSGDKKKIIVHNFVVLGDKLPPLF